MADDLKNNEFGAFDYHRDMSKDKPKENIFSGILKVIGNRYFDLGFIFTVFGIVSIR